jgi:hypothetical protein
VRDAEAHHLRHGRVVHEDLVDLARAHLLAAAVDDLLQAPGEADVALGVHRALVTGAEPPLGEGLDVGLVVVLVAGRDVGAADDDLADLAAPEQRARLAHDGHLGARGRPTEPGLRTAGGSGLEAIWWVASVMP